MTRAKRNQCETPLWNTGCSKSIRFAWVISITSSRQPASHSLWRADKTLNIRGFRQVWVQHSRGKSFVVLQLLLFLFNKPNYIFLEMGCIKSKAVPCCGNTVIPDDTERLHYKSTDTSDCDLSGQRPRDVEDGICICIRKTGQPPVRRKILLNLCQFDQSCHLFVLYWFSNFKNSEMQYFKNWTLS